jgi:hypothetical protein
MSQRGPVYRFFNAVARYQYSVADVIGVQTAGNLDYFSNWSSAVEKRLEVLQNWLFDSPISRCSICLDHTKLAGRKIFVYAGNMGVAQGMGVLLELAKRLRVRTDIGFLFVGRGSYAARLRMDADKLGLDNVAFHDEIDSKEIPGLYAQCHVGIVALDPRHKTHNIPGKFLSYLQAGLPILASINPGNDLEGIILREAVGRVCTEQSVANLQRLALELVEEVASSSVVAGNSALTDRCKALFAKLFSPAAAVQQIVAALNK